MRFHEPSLAVADQGTFVAWHGGTGDGSSIYIQQIDRRQHLIGHPIAVSDGQRLAYEPDLVKASDHLVVAWYERDKSTGDLSVWLAGLTGAGHRKWMIPLSAGGDQARNPVVRPVGGHLEVAWIEQPATNDGSNSATIWHQRISLTGEAMGPPQLIGQANRDTWNLNATVADGQFVVVYDAMLGSKTHELHMLIVGEAGAQHRNLSEDDGHPSLYPDLQVNHSRHAALTWFDGRDGNHEVYLRAVPFDRLGDGREASEFRVTNSPEDTIGAYVAWNGNTIGLAWTDRVSNQRDIFAQTFASDGSPLGPIRRLSSTREDAGVPSIRAYGPGFLVAWNDYVIKDGTATHMSVASSTAEFALVPVSD